jgi:hypothetical protein
VLYVGFNEAKTVQDRLAYELVLPFQLALFDNLLQMLGQLSVRALVKVVNEVIGAVLEKALASARISTIHGAFFLIKQKHFIQFN